MTQNSTPPGDSDSPFVPAKGDVAAVFGACVSLAILGIYLLLTQGDGRPKLHAYFAFGLYAWCTNCAFLLRLPFLLIRRNASAWARESLGPPLALAILLAVAALPGDVAHQGFLVLGGLGVIGLLLRWPLAIRQTGLLAGSFSVVCVLLLAAQIAGVIWGQKYYSTDILQGIAREMTHIDGLYNLSICRMYETYGQASLGLDGLTPIVSYLGSNWFLSRLPEPLHCSAIDVYEAVRPIFLLPLLIHACLLVTESLAQRPLFARQRGWVAPVLFLAMFLGILPYASNGENLIVISMWFQEAAQTSMVIAFWTAGIVLEAWRIHFHEGRFRADASSWLPFLFIPLGLVGMGLTKFSTMPVFLGIYGISFLRFRLYRRPLAWLSIILSTWAMMYLKSKFSTLSDSSSMRVMPVGLWRIWSNPAWWPYTIWIQLFWPLLLLISLCWWNKIRSLRELGQSLQRGQLPALEMALVTIGICAGPGMLWDLIAGAALYFWDWQRWIVMPLVLAALPVVSQQRVTWWDWPWRRWLLIAGTCSLFLMHLFNATYSLRLAVANSCQVRGIDITRHVENHWPGWPGVRHAVESSLKRRGFRTVIGIPRNFPPAEIPAPNQRVIDVLVELGNRPLSEKRHTAIFVPKRNLDYWSMYRSSYDRREPCFVAPAITGMACIDNLLEGDEIFNKATYSFSFFPWKEVDGAVPTELLPPEARKADILEQAKQWGFEQVLVFDQLPDGTFTILQWSVP